MPGGVSMITPAWRLWRFIRPCRASSFRPMRPVYDTLPVVPRFCNYAPTALLGIRYAPRIEVETSVSVGSPPLSPSAVRSHRAIKKRRTAPCEPVQSSYNSGEVSCRRCVVPCIGSLIRCKSTTSLFTLQTRLLNIVNEKSKNPCNIRANKSVQYYPLH